MAILQTSNFSFEWESPKLVRGLFGLSTINVPNFTLFFQRVVAKKGKTLLLIHTLGARPLKNTIWFKTNHISTLYWTFWLSICAVQCFIAVVSFWVCAFLIMQTWLTANESRPSRSLRRSAFSFLWFSFCSSLTWDGHFHHNPVTRSPLFKADILIYAWHAALWALKAPVQATTMSSRHDKKQVAPLLLWFAGDARLQKSTWSRSARLTAVCNEIASPVSPGDHRLIPVWSIPPE